MTYHQDLANEIVSRILGSNGNDSRKSFLTSAYFFQFCFNSPEIFFLQLKDTLLQIQRRLLRRFHLSAIFVVPTPLYLFLFPNLVPRVSPLHRPWERGCRRPDPGLNLLNSSRSPPPPPPMPPPPLPQWASP